MHLVEVHLEGFKGIDVRLDWSRINVLFGPNDAGKTNILEAVAAAFGGTGQGRVAVASFSRSPKISAVLELDDGDGEDELLGALLQRDHVPPIFPVPQQANEHGTTIDAHELETAPARLRWAGAGSGARSFTLTERSGGQTSRSSRDLPLSEALRLLHERGLRAMRHRLRNSHESWADTELLLRTALASRRFLYADGTLTLLCPLREEASPEVLTAAKRLTKRWRDDTVIGPFISQLADGGPTNQPLLRIMNRRELRPFDIVWAAATADDAQVEQVLRREFNRWYHEMKQASDVARELRHALRRLANDEARDALSRFIASTKVIGNTSPRERWLRHFPADRTAPAKWVNELADRVGASANDVAAPIVAAAGELELAVLEPSHWLAADRRLEPRLYQAHRDKPTPLVELGLGLRAWCEVAILEAATMQQNPALPVLERLRRDLQRVSRKGEQDPDDPENFSVGEPTFGTRTRLLIVDEPEQHLHPRAQREIAAWLAAGADNRDAFVATHALPFLDMPDERTSYFLVTRNNDGRTRATNISDNTFHALQQFSTEAGLSGRAEALQTIRIVALVEGAHDERVLRHFYGRELDRYRVLVVPVRGAKNVNAIVDSPWLSRMGFPYVVLFDETRASVVEGTKRPGGKDIAARAVWDMLHHWEDPRPPPYVASFGLADIFRALPEECVAKAVRAASGSFPGWADVDAAFEGRSSIGFKPLLLERSKLPPETDLDALLEAALDVCRVRPHEDLESAARTLIDYARMAIRPAATSTPRETV